MYMILLLEPNLYRVRVQYLWGGYWSRRHFHAVLGFFGQYRLCLRFGWHETELSTKLLQLKQWWKKNREPGSLATVLQLIAGDFQGFADDFLNLADNFQNFTDDVQNFIKDFYEFRRQAPRSPQGFFLHWFNTFILLYLFSPL